MSVSPNPVRCIRCGRWTPDTWAVLLPDGYVCPACTCQCDQCKQDIEEYDAAETKRILDELSNQP